MALDAQPVPLTPNGDDHGASERLVELATKVGDVDLDDVGVTVEVRSPHRLEHRRLRVDLVGAIEEHIAADKPFLGICLGLQLLFDVSFEDGEYEGLGIVPGEVVRFESQPGLRIPHMGWNEITYTQQLPVFADIPEGSHFYFVHSYHVVPQDESVIACRTNHGGEFVSAIAKGQMVATQFHPEKSQTYGLKLLENFASQLMVK